jgi:hypothetical protein
MARSNSANDSRSPQEKRGSAQDHRQFTKGRVRMPTTAKVGVPSPWRHRGSK